MVKQLRLIIGVMFLAILVYSGLWFTAAFQAEKDTVSLLATWRDSGLRVDHGKITHGGFPYRITVEIEDLSIQTRSNGLNIQADKLVLNSHLWTANHWVAQASGVQASLADNALSFEDNELTASYKLYENGQQVVALDTLSTDDFVFTQFFGITPPQLINWQVFLRFGDTASQDKDGLYGERYMDVKLSAKTSVSSLEATGGISGTVIRDWNKTNLSNWRDEGGLLEANSIDLRTPKGRLQGSMNVTLDENFKPLGSANMTVSGGDAIAQILKDAGIHIDGIPTSGPLNLMLQNGRCSNGTNNGEKLKAIIN